MRQFPGLPKYDQHIIVDSFMSRRILVLMLILAITNIVGCKKTPSGNSRHFHMGFQLSAPRYELSDMIRSLDIWSTRADAAMITSEVPWDSLYGGVKAEDFTNS